MTLFTSWQVWALDSLGVLFVLYHFGRDRFATLNRVWDRIEEEFFPDWFSWHRWGNPITWVHHTLTAATLAAFGGLASFLIGGPFWVGFAHWAIGMAGFYIVREYLNWKRNEYRAVKPGFAKSWKVDGVMDTVGPILLAVGAIWRVVG